MLSGLHLGFYLGHCQVFHLAIMGKPGRSGDHKLKDVARRQEALSLIEHSSTLATEMLT